MSKGQGIDIVQMLQAFDELEKPLLNTIRQLNEENMQLRAEIAELRRQLAESMQRRQPPPQPDRGAFKIE